MADNLDITPGSGAKKHRSHETGTVHTPIAKIALGATNAAETILAPGRQAAAVSLPVTSSIDAAGFQTIAELAGTSLTSSFQNVGTFTASTKIGSFVNTTTSWVVFSCNGGTNPHIRVPPNSIRDKDFGAAGLNTAAVVWAKHDGVVPASGVVAIEGQQ